MFFENGTEVCHIFVAHFFGYLVNHVLAFRQQYFGFLQSYTDQIVREGFPVAFLNIRFK